MALSFPCLKIPSYMRFEVRGFPDVGVCTVPQLNVLV